MAEEVQRLEKVIAFTIICIIAIGLTIISFYLITMFFSMQDLQDFFDAPILVPILKLFNQALSN